jgi:macrolide-specific efflux system membrane fusion protein
MPTTSNNVVLYKGSFDIDNSDGELFPGMTTQVFFVTSSARNVLTVPIGALTFAASPADQGGASYGREGSRGEGMPGREDMASRAAQFAQGGGEITPEMRARIEQMRAGGGGAEGFGGRGGGRGGRGTGSAGGFPGGGAPEGGFPGAAGAAEGEEGATPPPQLAAAFALNQPRNATVQLVQADGTQVTREVVVGASDRVNAEVISGLVEGDRVVAGIVQERVEQEESNNNNNNQWRGGGGGFPGGGGFRF